MSSTPFSTRYVRQAAAGAPRSHQDRPDLDATTRAHAAVERALVVGGGGSAGNAWLVGVIAGLFDVGLDVTAADLVIGTSAGATTAAQITSATPSDLLAAIAAAAAPPRPSSPAGSDGGRGPQRPATDNLARTSAVIAASTGPVDMRRRMGAAALELAASPDGSGQARWRAMVTARLPGQQWPQSTMLVTAVDARTGEPVVFDRHSGVDLVDAVAASCSSGPPYWIGGVPYIDGGYRRSSENADLATGSGRVLVLSPFGGRTRHPLEWGMQLAVQVDELRGSGSRVETVFPDGESLTAFGDNMMDLSTRQPAARAGYDQGRALVERLTGFWR